MGTASAAAVKPDLYPNPGGDTPVYTWQNQGDGNYMEVQSSGTSNGDKIDVYKKTGSCAAHGATDTICNEEWYAISLGTNYDSVPEFAYMNVNSGLCLDDPGGGIGGHVEQWSCTTYPDTKRWLYDKSYSDQGPTNGYFNLWNLDNAEIACLHPGTAAISFYPRWVWSEGGVPAPLPTMYDCEWE